MMIIALNLNTSELENNYSIRIKLSDKDFTKAIATINDANLHVPNIRYIQDKLGLSDEIDVILDALDKAKIKYELLKDDASFDISESYKEGE